MAQRSRRRDGLHNRAAAALANIPGCMQKPIDARTETHHCVSDTVPDWSREQKHWLDWDPSRSLLASLRSYQRHADGTGFASAVIRKVAVFRHRFWSIATGAEIPINCRIAGGLLLPHPNGVVVHCDTVIGPNCLLFQQVTLGSTMDGSPVLAGHVDVGAGAKVLGAVTLGAHAKVGANAVVLIDVPSGATAVGLPAKVIAKATQGAGAND